MGNNYEFFNARSITESIRKVAIETIDNRQPVEIILGLVVRDTPLTIQLTDNFTLSAAAIVVPEYLTDHEIKLGNDDNVVMYKNRLRNGDKVIICKMQGGKRFLVLDRVG